MIDISRVYENLIEKGFIEYGKIIPKSLIEKLLEEKQSNHNPWDYINPFLKLKEHVEKHGFLCQCKNGSLRILPLEEMPNKCERIDKNFFKKQQKLITSMRNAEIDKLAEEMQRTHNHYLHKMTMILHSSKKILNDI
jgi:hypothetical protein